MGAYLSQPITEKETQDGGDESGLRWGAAGMQGWRTGMEDSYLACLDLGTSRRGEESSNSETRDPPLAAFAVFDGHGGAEVAKYCSAHICEVMRETPGFKEGNYGQGMKQTFLRMDDLLRSPDGQVELLKLKEEDSSSKGADSDSDGDGGADSDVLSKIDRETQKQFMERMRKAISEKFLSQGMELGVSGLGALGAGAVDKESGDDGDSEDSSGSENDGDVEKQQDGSHTNEASAASDGEAKGDGTRTTDGLTTKAERLVGDALEPKNEIGEGAILLNGSAPLAEGAQALSASSTAPSASPAVSVSVSVGPVGGEGDGDGDGDHDGSLVARKRVGGEEWGNAALKLEVDEAEGPALESELGTRQRCGFDCGATAVMGLLIGGKTLVVANAGDSRCVVSRKGVAVDMSEDHKPEDEAELSRIEKAGGAVVDGRVQGNLNLSRAIGDLMYKVDEALPPEEQMITADPDLRTLEITDEDEFIVLACDGVWNSLSSQETVDVVRERLRGSASTPVPLPLSSICADLCDACCAETADGDGTGLDNVTAILVELHTTGARTLTGRAAAKVAIADSAAEAEGSGDMDLSDDGKRKQGDGGGGGVKERSGKLMRPAVEAVSGGGSGD